MKKEIITAIAALFITALAFGGKYYYDFVRYEAIIPTIEISDVDLSSIADGVYLGDFNAHILRSQVSVTVKDSAIEDIEFIRHKYERGKPAEAILTKVIDQQSLEVDAVSSATNSSLVILKSIENALTGDNHTVSGQESPNP